MAEKTQRLVAVDDATVPPYATILSYPRPDEAEVRSKIRQLRELGVVQLEFGGRLKFDNLSILGKGVAGMVLVGVTPSGKVALKIRRSDSRRDSMSHEASMLQAANVLGVGPRYLGNTVDVLAMEFVEGETLPRWLSSLKGRGRRSRARSTIRNLLGQCFRLDQAGLDHGELSRAHKNIIVLEEGQPCILDFESASKDRRANNLTALTQYFFLGGGFSRRVARVVGPVDRRKLIKLLRSYKSEVTADLFDKVMDSLKLPA